jgi:hypothetical protein
MSLPKALVLGLVSPILGVALAAGALVGIGGARDAQASTTTPEALSAAVGAVPRGGDTAAARHDAIAVAPGNGALSLGPVDSAAVAAGFRDGGYRFSVRSANFPSFAAASPLENGVVSDTAHFALEWPDARFISRYVRDDETRTAWVGDSVLDLVPGDGWERTPDEMLPVDFYVAAIEPWTSALPAASRDGTYTAPSEVLAGMAEAIGFSGADWTLSVTVDGRGRLVAARFAGSAGRSPFLMDIAVTYDDEPGAAIEPAPSAATEPPAAGDRGDRGR